MEFQQKQEVIQVITLLREARDKMKQASELWGNIEYNSSIALELLEEDYPFKESFDDWLSVYENWVFSDSKHKLISKG